MWIMVKMKNISGFKKLNIFFQATTWDIALENLLYSMESARRTGKFYCYPSTNAWDMIKIPVDEIKIPLNTLR